MKDFQFLSGEVDVKGEGVKSGSATKVCPRRCGKCAPQSNNSRHSMCKGRSPIVIKGDPIRSLFSYNSLSWHKIFGLTKHFRTFEARMFFLGFYDPIHHRKAS